LPLVTTVSLRVAQLIARHKPFVAAFNMPFPAIHGKSELPFIFYFGKRQRTFEVQETTFGLAVSCAALN
jgi:hypothetical protein